MQEMEQEAPQVKSTPYQTPMHNFGSSILYLTNPENELYKIELTLRGEKLDREGNTRTMGPPLMNDEGIGSVMGELQTIVNQVTVMSSLDNREITALMDFLADTLAKDLMINWRRYALNPVDRDRVFFYILSSAFICMKRAASDELSDKKFWRGSVQEINTQVQNGQRNKGLLSWMMPWKK